MSWLPARSGPSTFAHARTAPPLRPRPRPPRPHGPARRRSDRRRGGPRLQARGHRRRGRLELGDPVGEADQARAGADPGHEDTRARLRPLQPRRCPARLKVRASKFNDLTVQRRVGRLDPDTNYRYRFCTPGGARSATGKFTTAAGPKQRKTIRFALAGDQDARPRPGGTKPYWNRFGVWRRIIKQRNDFNVLMGDTIYSDTEVPGYERRTSPRPSSRSGMPTSSTSARGRGSGPAARPPTTPTGTTTSSSTTSRASRTAFRRATTARISATSRSTARSSTSAGSGPSGTKTRSPYTKETGIYRSERWGKNSRSSSSTSAPSAAPAPTTTANAITRRGAATRTSPRPRRRARAICSR